jgi:hypothetical protein
LYEEAVTAESAKDSGRYPRGLFRTWILISIFWMIIGGSITAYKIVGPNTIWGSFQPWLTDEEVGLAPQAEQKQLSHSFFSIRDIRADILHIQMPDGSKLYMPASLSEGVRTRIAEEFWDQRWGRWARAAATVSLWAFVPCLLLFIFGYSLLACCGSDADSRAIGGGLRPNGIPKPD